MTHVPSFQELVHRKNPFILIQSCVRFVSLQVQNLYNLIVTRLGDPVSEPKVDLAKLRPRQQWLLWFVFHSDANKRRKLKDIITDEESEKLKEAPSSSGRTEALLSCAQDTVENAINNVNAAACLFNANAPISTMGNGDASEASDHPDQDPSNASDAISQTGDEDEEGDDAVSDSELFGDPDAALEW